jgi:putative aldouronate transport system permease protein
MDVHPLSQTRKIHPVIGTLMLVFKQRWLFFMMLPGLVYFFVFKYIPMWGLLLSLKNYSPYQGFFGSPWVGLVHFQRLFSDPDFFQILRNTVVLSLMNLLLYFPMPIIISLLLNELPYRRYKSLIQTVVYVPHFISWVVVVGMTYVLLNPESGVVNNLMLNFGKSPPNFLLDKNYFRPLYIIQIIWKETGWGTIIFFAALSGIDPSLYEACEIDGGNRWHRLWYVTLPEIRGVIITMFILRLGHFLDTGFEQIYMQLNAMTREYAEVFDTFIYVMALQQGQFSYSTAIGVFKSIIGITLILGANSLVKKMGEEGIL